MKDILLANNFIVIANDKLGYIYLYTDANHVLKHGNFILSQNFEYCIEKNKEIIPISPPLANFEDVKILLYLITHRIYIEELYLLIDEHGNG